MVKDYLDSELGNSVILIYGMLFSTDSKESFICIIHRQDSAYHYLWYTGHGALVGKTKSTIFGLPRSFDPVTQAPWSRFSIS